GDRRTPDRTPWRPASALSESRHAYLAAGVDDFTAKPEPPTRRPPSCVGPPPGAGRRRDRSRPTAGLGVGVPAGSRSTVAAHPVAPEKRWSPGSPGSTPIPAHLERNSN